MTRLILLCVALALLLTPAAASERFKDVPDDHWAAKSVDKLAEMGIMQGYPDKTFGGEKPVTRYELAVSLVKMIESIRASQKPLAPPIAPSTEQPKPAAAPAAPPSSADPAAFLKSGGFLTEDSVLLQRDTNKPVTMDQLAQTFATVVAKLMEERVPPKVN